MKVRAWILSSVTVVYALGVPAAGLAEPVDDPITKAQRDAREALLYTGDKASWSDFLGKSIDAWRAAWELDKTDFGAACDIGRAAQRVGGRAREVAEFMTLCVAGQPGSPPTDAKDKKWTEYREELAAARLEVGALRIEVSEPGAEVAIDGQSVGRSPLTREVFVDPGKHRVSAMLAGRESAAEAIDIRKGSSQTVSLKLKLLPPTPPLALRPVPPKPLPPGTQPNAAVIVGGVGLTVGMAVLGSVFSAMSSDKETESDAHLRYMSTGLSPLCKDRVNDKACIASEKARQASQTYGVLSGVSFAAAGVAALGTVVYVVLPRGGGITAATSGRDVTLSIVF